MTGTQGTQEILQVDDGSAAAVAAAAAEAAEALRLTATEWRLSTEGVYDLQTLKFLVGLNSPDDNLVNALTAVYGPITGFRACCSSLAESGLRRSGWLWPPGALQTEVNVVKQDGSVIRNWSTSENAVLPPARAAAIIGLKVFISHLILAAEREQAVAKAQGELRNIAGAAAVAPPVRVGSQRAAAFAAEHPHDPMPMQGTADYDSLNAQAQARMSDPHNAPLGGTGVNIFPGIGTNANTAATPNHVHGLPDAALGAYQTTPNAGDNHPPPYLM
jgi:hypothetical protein